MRKVTQQAAQAFLAGKSGTFGNTTVTHRQVSFPDGCQCEMLLHGNSIARMVGTGDVLRVTLAGWPTPTTRERVNGLLALFIASSGNTVAVRPFFHQSGGLPMLNGYEADPSAWYTFNRRGELVP